jgi:hypothetical protein
LCFIKIKCFVEKKPLGTGGALNLIKKSKYMINSGENFYTFFLMESIKYKVKIIYNKKTCPFTKPKVSDIFGVDYDKYLVARIQILNYIYNN